MQHFVGVDTLYLSLLYAMDFKNQTCVERQDSSHNARDYSIQYSMIRRTAYRMHYLLYGRIVVSGCERQLRITQILRNNLRITAIVYFCVMWTMDFKNQTCVERQDSSHKARDYSIQYSMHGFVYDHREIHDSVIRITAYRMHYLLYGRIVASGCERQLRITQILRNNHGLLNYM